MATNSPANLEVSNLSVGYSIAGGTTKRKLTVKGSGNTALLAQQTIDLTLPNQSADTTIGKGDFSAKGSLLVGTGSGTFTSLGVGSNTQLLKADSAQSSGVVWADAPTNPTSPNTVYDFEDFTAYNPDTVTSSAGIMWTSYLYALGSTGHIATESTASPTTVGRPGVLTLISSGTVPANCGVYSIDNVPFGQGAIDITFSIYLDALSTGTQTYSLYAGFGAVATSSSAPTAGAFLTYTDSANSGKWQGISIKVGSGTSTANSTVTVSAATWYKLRIVANAAGTQINYYVNDVEISGSPLTTNIETTNDMVCFVKILNTVGTNAKTLRVDYIQKSISFTTSR